MGAFYLQLSTLYIDFSIITTLKSNKTAKKLNIEKFPQFAEKLFATTKFSQYLCTVK